jgi:ABC-2 type transport system ATP-binding protein
MRAKDVLRFFASVRGTNGDLERALRLAGRLDLNTDRRVALMSTGMRQKLALVSALSHDNPLLILDEPTANLDPTVRREVMAILRELRAEGKTILLSSHVLSEIEEISDRVVILRDGGLVHTQNMKQLRSKYRIKGHRREKPWQIQIPPDLANRVTVQQHDDRLCIETDGDLADVLPWIASLALRAVTVEPNGLRSVYEAFHHSEETP